MFGDKIGEALIDDVDEEDDDDTEEDAVEADVDEFELDPGVSSFSKSTSFSSLFVLLVDAVFKGIFSFILFILLLE